MLSAVFIRGLPGSGKSTQAQAMAGYTHLEADQYFIVDGVYIYDPKNISVAHAQCKASMRAALEAGESVVIANTFTRKQEMTDYLAIAAACGATVQIIEATGRWASIHGVPVERIEQMRQRWEKFDM